MTTNWMGIGLSFAAICIVAGLGAILLILWDKYR